VQYDPILERLQRDYGLKHRGDYLREGKCPDCGKRELFISAIEPHNLKCGRESKCSWSAKTRDLYPDLWKPLHELYPATREDPNATAKAYLKTRGLNPALFAGQFQQGQRIERNAIRKPGHTETVRFFLTADKSVWWERFLVPIEMPDKPKKAHFNGSYKGHWWAPAGFAAGRGDQVFLVEGILDALSLIQSGFRAVSLMSCNNWPETAIKPHLGQGIQWVLALDNDPAGQRYNLKYHRELQRLGESVAVCTAPDRDKRDWNDLLQAGTGRISPDDLTEWFHAGRLLAADSAKAKALELVAHTGKQVFTMDFGNQLYAVKYSDRDEDEPVKLEKIANCKPEFLYFERDTLGMTGSTYYLRISRSCGKAYQGAFASSVMGSDKEFNNKLMDTGAGLMFTGTKKQLQRHMQDYWFPTGERPAEVKTINYMGYSKELKCWLFPKQSVFNGRYHELNQDDYFDLDEGLKVKTTFRQNKVSIGSLDAHQPERWLDLFRTTYGQKGLVALAYWAGSFFAEQIRDKYGFYPFLELCGVAGTGKTNLLEFLWKLSGREGYEGADFAKFSAATRRRTLEQVANLPVVVTEADREDGKGLDMTFFKTLYNGKGVGGTSPRNHGNETNDYNFRGTLIFAQNTPIEGKPEVVERVVQIPWDKSHFTSAGHEALGHLRALDMDRINGFMTACIVQEKRFLALFDEGCQFAVKALKANRELTNQRVIENHAMIMAASHALKASGVLDGLLTGDLEGIDRYLTSRCEERHRQLDGDTALVQLFWDVYHYLEHETKHAQVNHSKDPTRIAISLNDFIDKAKTMNQPFMDLAQLKKELKGSKRFPFIKYGGVRSKLAHDAVRDCYIFANTEGEQQDSRLAA